MIHDEVNLGAEQRIKTTKERLSAVWIGSDSCDNCVLLEAPAQLTKNSKHAPANVIGSYHGRSKMSMRNARENARVKRI
ncbi:hypothetical protein P5673_014383 [Acropora cervicornis]|uniref:Uncharacterized protein n=1 Tax=Acropora cervicornis TaxID=6130 RepID=A0AAD9QJV0_ACRCE|nr:hypothetical protein P5673_014383 [Acropora cervicornis]